MRTGRVFGIRSAGRTGWKVVSRSLARSTVSGASVRRVVFVVENAPGQVFRLDGRGGSHSCSADLRSSRIFSPNDVNPETCLVPSQVTDPEMRPLRLKPSENRFRQMLCHLADWSSEGFSAPRPTGRISPDFFAYNSARWMDSRAPACTVSIPANASTVSAASSIWASSSTACITTLARSLRFCRRAVSAPATAARARRVSISSDAAARASRTSAAPTPSAIAWTTSAPRRVHRLLYATVSFAWTGKAAGTRPRRRYSARALNAGSLASRRWLSRSVYQGIGHPSFRRIGTLI